MTPGFAPAQASVRNPVARSLALAVLGVGFLGAAILGGVVFLVLLGLYAVGYLVTRLHAWGRLFRLRRRAVFMEQAPAPAFAYEVVEATADVAQSGSGGSA